MEHNKFYNHVSSWIHSYQNPEALEWLRRFVNNSYQSKEVKEKLHQEIDWKIADLRKLPSFYEVDGCTWLVDANGHPKVFTTRFSAICAIAALKLKSYDVELVGGLFYRIRQVHETVNTIAQEMDYEGITNYAGN